MTILFQRPKPRDRFATPRVFCRTLLLMLALVLLLPSVTLARNVCKPQGDVPVVINPIFEQAHYNYSENIASIQRMGVDTSHSIHESLTLGVTHYEPMLELRLPIETLTYPDGVVCSDVKSGDVSIGFRDVTVYIAEEIPVGSCGFNEIMAHEQKHIQVNWQILQEFLPRMREEASAFLKANGHFEGGDAASHTLFLRQGLQQLLNNSANEMMTANVERQKEVDSPAEYHRISVSCNGQLARIAGLAMRPNR